MKETKKGLRAVIKCGTCGSLTEGESVPIPDSQTIDAQVAEESLCSAVSGLTRARGSDLRCPACGNKVLQPGSQLFLVFDSVDGTVH